MALTCAQATPAVGDTVARTAYPTASFTPVANRLYLAVAVYTPEIASGGGFSNFSTTTGLTFVDTGLANGWASGAGAMSVYRALKSSGLSAGTVTANFTNNRTGCIIMVIEWDGVDTSGTDGSGAIAQAVGRTGIAGSTPTVPLAAFGSANNGTFGTFGAGNSSGITVGGAFASASSTTYNTPNTSGLAEYALSNQTTVDASNSSAWVGFAFEIVAAAAAGRATKNSRSHPLGVGIGMARTMGGQWHSPMARHQSGLYVPERMAA